MTDKPKAYSYLRFSTPEQEKGDSFRRQTELAKRWCEQHGVELDEALTFHDLGVSAFYGANLETGQLGAFLYAVKAGEVAKGSYLLIESLDRLSRQKPRRATRILENICEEGIQIVTITDGKVYSEEILDEDPMAMMWALMVAMRAHDESAMKQMRLKAAWKGKREKASEKPLTSITPGWISLERATNKLVVNEERAAIVRRIFDMTLAGHGQHFIANTFNQEGLPCFGRGKLWHRTYIKKTLGNEAVIGIYIPHIMMNNGLIKTRIAQDRIYDYFPRIIDDETFENIQALNSGNSRSTHVKSGTTITNLFAGLARCPLCGGTMTRVMKGSVKKSGRPKLVCTSAKARAGCEYHSINLIQAEAAFTSNIRWIADTCPSGEYDLDEQIRQTEASIGILQDTIDTLVEELLRAEKRGRSVEAIRDRLDIETETLEVEKQRLGHLEDRAAIASRKTVQRRVAEMEAAITAHPFDKAKANTTMRQCFDQVVVNFKSGMIELYWKHGGDTQFSFMWPA